jgi:ABC-type branched-subunit amino acid transport system ATPase component
MSAAPLLQVRGLTRAFGGLVAVNALDLDVAEGQIVGLLGPNGSGKSTAINLLSGALRPDSGSVHLSGKPIAGLPAHRVARSGLARTCQLVRVLPSLSVVENVVAGLAYRPHPLWGAAARREAMSMLARVGLADRSAHVPGQLTYIDMKRLELARALALSPRLLLLDEWLAGLNPSELQEGVVLVASLRDEGLSVLLVEHVMEAVRLLCDRCVVMNAGLKIAEGATDAVLSNNEVIRAYLGDPDA